MSAAEGLSDELLLSRNSWLAMFVRCMVKILYTNLCWYLIIVAVSTTGTECGSGNALYIQVLSATNQAIAYSISYFTTKPKLLRK